MTLTKMKLATGSTIDRDMIERVYSGKPGCGCGCRGVYSHAAGSITRIVNAMNARADEVEVNVWSDGSIIFVLEDDDRYRWAYAKKAS